MAQNDIALHVIRRNNLLALYRQFAADRLTGTGDATGIDAAFAAHIQVSPSMLSQIKTHRPIGSRVARQIESALKLEEGRLDIERESAPVVTAAQLKFEKLARRLWAEGSAKQKREATTMLMAIMADYFRSSSQRHDWSVHCPALFSNPENSIILATQLTS